MRRARGDPGMCGVARIILVVAMVASSVAAARPLSPQQQGAARSDSAVTASAVTAGGVVAGPVARAASTASAVPRPDHIVVLLMENHSAANILGNPQAPYLNALAASGASMTASYAIAHPSQPNYVALFSGAVNGIADDTCPHAIDADNLGTDLLAAGLGFVTYSEDLPSAGYAGCTFGNYARKHNPMVDFPSVPASANQPLTAFPTDYATLPAVSFLVPNLQHDMHDGTVAQGDVWVQSTVKGYVTWATQHNSLLILTYDEDDYGSNNQIPTIIVGAGVTPGQYAEHITHYNVLRTLTDAFGLAPIGAGVAASPILDIWTPPDGSPQSSFTAVCTGLSCAFDSSASTGGAGAITGVGWSWGDGSPPTTGSTGAHSYAAPGDYQVVLTVTNGAGLSGTSSRTVSPRSMTDPALFAADAFARTVSAGLGVADLGGPWTVTGPVARYGVNGGIGSLSMSTAGATTGVSLPLASSSDTDLRVSLSTDKLAAGNGTYVTLIGRQVSVNNSYQASVRIRGDGVPLLSLTALEGSTAAVTLKPAITVPGLTVGAGGVLRTRFQVTGTSPTTLRLKVWAAAATEPAAWQLSVTDLAPALQTSGSLGITGYLSGTSTNAPVVLRLSDFSARTTAVVAANSPPVAAARLTCTGLSCSADGTASSDPDGTVTGWSWNWGDGSAPTSGSTSVHAYTVGGDDTVTLTVTDNRGGTGIFAVTVHPAAPVNQPPVALLTLNCTNLVCTADGTTSTDADGTITGYGWSWGDGSPDGTGPTASHAYLAAGTYPVTLTVTDDTGATNTALGAVSPTMAANVLPTASLRVSCVGLLCSADSAGSSDPDGSVTGQSWDWGDSSAPTGGVTSAHAYATAGSHTVTLTVTDNRGGTGSATATAVPTAPDTAFALDRFNRAVTGGWGTADIGGAWTTAGPTTGFSVSGGSAGVLFTKAGVTASGYLATAPRSSADLTTTVATDKRADNSGMYYTFVGRRVGTNLEYESRARVTGTGSVVLSLTALTGTATAVTLAPQITVPGLTIPVGAAMNSRVQVSGTNPTTVRAKVWAGNSTEPSGWQLSAVDPTPALQSAGSVGVIAYLSSSATNAPIVLRLSALAARPVL